MKSKTKAELAVEVSQLRAEDERFDRLRELITKARNGKNLTKKEKVELARLIKEEKSYD